MRLNQKILICVLSVVLPCAMISAQPASSAPAANFSSTQVTNIQNIIHSYLVAHPEVLVEAWESLQQKKELAAQQAATQAIGKNIQALLFDPNNPVAGDPSAPVTIVEFFDYQCSHCRTIGPILDNLLHSHKNLRVVFKDWPIFKGNSILAAKAAFAANMQGKYMQYHQMLLDAKPPLDMDNIMDLAHKADLDLVKFKQDMDSSKWDSVLKNNAKLAADLKLIGTPAFVVSNRTGSKIKFIPGGVSEAAFSKIIASIAAT